jgi:arylsulfatase A-like enzyme
MGEDLDGCIGAVLEKIDTLGIENQTYVIVVSDNGYRHREFDELSGRGQPLHGAKWWGWQGGLRVPMIVKGPDIPAGAINTANVVHYDFLPTFVEWAGGTPDKDLTEIDGISLAGMMRGQAPGNELLSRNIYFHYPHYRTSMPHSAVVSGNHKVMYFYETPVRFPSHEPIMLFDLSADAGEYTNIFPEKQKLGQRLYDEMIEYFKDVGARMPLVPNPNYDKSIYKSDASYADRILWGPFQGTRPTEEDE